MYLCPIPVEFPRKGFKVITLEVPSQKVQKKMSLKKIISGAHFLATFDNFIFHKTFLCFPMDSIFWEFVEAYHFNKILLK